MMLKNLLSKIAIAGEQPDQGEQRRIDHEFLLEIEGSIISLFRNEFTMPPGREQGPGAIPIQQFLNGQPIVQFEWKDIIEIRILTKSEGFPGTYWCIETEHGAYLLPCGGHYAQVLEREFICRLPGYYEQQTVPIEVPPLGYARAMSLWRHSDPYPPKSSPDNGNDMW